MYPRSLVGVAAPPDIAKSWRLLPKDVKSAAVKALRDALENEVAALVLKILVEYQVADIAGHPIKID